MASLFAAITLLLVHEGGYVNNPVDPGGPTNYGISLRFLRNQKGFNGDIDGDGDIDADDVKGLTVADVTKIYSNEFWYKYGFEKLENQRLANMVFGLSVNLGPKNAIYLLQKAVNRFLKPKTVFIPNGIFDEKLIETSNKLEIGPIIFSYKYEVNNYYRELTRKNKNLGRFINGWLKRLNSY